MIIYLFSHLYIFLRVLCAQKACKGTKKNSYMQEQNACRAFFSANLAVLRAYVCVFERIFVILQRIMESYHFK